MQRVVGGDHQMATGTQHPPRFSQKGVRTDEVLDHVSGYDQVEAGGLEGQVSTEP